MVRRIDEVVTGVEVSVELDDGDVAAGRPEDTQGVFQIESRSGCLLEDLDFDCPNVFVHPFVEDGTEEIAPGYWSGSEGADAGRGVEIGFDKRQKADVGGIDFLEKTVDT